MKKKKILIISADSSLPYQPSILNLYHELNKHFDTQIISFNYYNKFTPVANDINVTYLIPVRLLKKCLFFIDLVINKYLIYFFRLFNKKYNYENDLFKKLQVRILVKFLKTTQADEYIAVDFLALYAVQKVVGTAHLLSLEIYPNDQFADRVNLSNIKSVIIPTEERYEYLFGNKKIRKFIIPNSPSYIDYEKCPISERKGLIWAGTIDTRFGVQYVIEFIKAFPQYTLTLKGSFVHGMEKFIRTKYADLIETQKLIINTSYMSSDLFNKYVSSFRIGFCFYDWDVIRNNINYYLGAGGRLYVYYAAGIPTIGCNTPGLKSVTDFNAGILLNDYKPDTILNAIQKIEQSYESISENSTNAAKEFSFDRNVAPFIEYLKLL